MAEKTQDQLANGQPDQMPMTQEERAREAYMQQDEAFLEAQAATLAEVKRRRKE